MAQLSELSWGMGIVLAGLVGLVLGSFIATLVLRWPDGRSVLGRSKCDGCGRVLGVVDLIPLVSAIILRGKCRSCDGRIDPFHSGVELIAAAIGVTAMALVGGTTGWLWALFGWLLLPLILLDARHLWLPDPLNAVLAFAGLLLAGPLTDSSLLDRWVGAVAGGGLLALVGYGFRRLRGVDGLGGGDPKMMAAIGCWLGWQSLPFMLLLASVSGLVWAIFTQGKGDPSRSLRRIPFGTFLGIAAWAAVPLWPMFSALSGR